MRLYHWRVYDSKSVASYVGMRMAEDMLLIRGLHVKPKVYRTRKKNYAVKFKLGG